MTPGLIKLELHPDCPYPVLALEAVETPTQHMASLLIAESNRSPHGPDYVNKSNVEDAVRSRLLRTRRIICPMIENDYCPAGLDCQLAPKSAPERPIEPANYIIILLRNNPTA